MSQAFGIPFSAFVDELRNQWSVPLPDDVNAEANLADHLGADSLQLFQLVVLTEELAELASAPTAIPELHTLADAFAYYRFCCAVSAGRGEG